MDVQFKKWASSIGCPLEFVPSDSTLQSFFKSRQGTVLQIFMRKIRPRQDVETIRRILSKRGDSIHSSQTLKVAELEKRRDALETEINELRKGVKVNYDKVKSRNAAIIQKQLEKNLMEDKSNLYELKHSCLEANIAKEVEHKTNIDKESIASNEVLIEESVKYLENAIRALDDFYNNENLMADSQISNASKPDLWVKLQPICAEIPNSQILYEAICKKTDDLLCTVEARNHDAPGNGETSKEPPMSSTFDLNIVRMRAKCLGLAVKYVQTRKKRHFVEKQLLAKVAELHKVLCVKCGYNNEEATKLLRDCQMHFFSNHSENFIRQQIAHSTKQYNIQMKTLTNHDFLVQELREAHKNHNLLANHMQFQLVQLGQIKHKIMYMSQTIQHVINEENLNATSNYDASSAYIFKNTTSLDLTLLNIAPKIEDCPLYTELKFVSQLSLTNIIDVLSYCWKFYKHENIAMKPNHIRQHQSTQLPDVQILSKVYDRPISSDLRLLEFEQSRMRSTYNQEIEFILSLILKIKTINEQANHKADCVSRLWTVINNNLLQNFISKSKLVNKRSFSEYEAEFSVFYNMIAND